jgi:hypothetical protein
MRVLRRERQNTHNLLLESLAVVMMSLRIILTPLMMCLNLELVMISLY